MAFGTKILDSAANTVARITQKFGIAGSNEGVLHVAQYPIALTTSEGSYKVGLVSGTMAAGLAANAEVFQFRWASATLNCALRSVKLSATVAGTAFAAGAPSFKMTPARSWTVAGSGGTAATLTGNNLKSRTDFATTVVGDVRIASTAILGLGTKTLDSSDVGAIVGVSGTATTGQIVPPGTDLYNRYSSDEYPILLEANEGFAIRATVPATGTWTFAVTVEWTETLVATF
jgi:hypothetical protein